MDGTASPCCCGTSPCVVAARPLCVAARPPVVAARPPVVAARPPCVVAAHPCVVASGARRAAGGARWALRRAPVLLRRMGVGVARRMVARSIIHPPLACLRARTHVASTNREPISEARGMLGRETRCALLCARIKEQRPPPARCVVRRVVRGALLLACRGAQPVLHRVLLMVTTTLCVLVRVEFDVLRGAYHAQRIAACGLQRSVRRALGRALLSCPHTLRPLM